MLCLCIFKGSDKEYQLWVNSGKEDAPYPLIGKFLENMFDIYVACSVSILLFSRAQCSEKENQTHNAQHIRPQTKQPIKLNT